MTRILDLDERERTLTEYAGDYDAYARAKSAARARWEEDYERQREEMAALRARMRETAQASAHPKPVEQTRYGKMAYDAHGAAAQRAPHARFATPPSGCAASKRTQSSSRRRFCASRRSSAPMRHAPSC